MTSTRQPFVAFGLSILWPGLGHLYQGLNLRGLLWFAVAIPALFVGITGALGAVGSLAAIAVFTGCAVDAYRCCSKPRTSEQIVLASVTRD